MNLFRTVFVGLAAAASSGCFTARPSRPDEFYHQAARNLTEQPAVTLDERVFTRFVRKRAEAAWDDVCRTAGKTFSRDYADGFVEGFVDYVEAGGTGEPPYLPPLCYRLTKYRTDPAKQASVDDWYAGFRQGAAVARGSGLRELNYVPLPGPSVPTDLRRNASPVPAAQPPEPAPVPPPVPVMPPPIRPTPARPEGLPLPRPQMPPPTPPASAAPVPFLPAPAAGKVPVTPGMSARSVPVASPFPSPSPWPGSPVVSPAVVQAVSTRAAGPAKPPVVVVEHAVPAVAPTPSPSPSPSHPTEFSPWQPAPRPPGPTVIREPS